MEGRGQRQDTYLLSEAHLCYACSVPASGRIHPLKEGTRSQRVNVHTALDLLPSVAEVVEQK